jgi:hypothetical protein
MVGLLMDDVRLMRADKMNALDDAMDGRSRCEVS